MSYFKRFPFLVGYKLQGKIYDTTDLTRRTAVQQGSIDNEDVAFKYSIINGETPEMLADRIYDDVNLYWVILLFNKIMDVESEWPLDQVSFERYVSRVYGSELYSIRFYRAISSGLVVDEDFPEYDRIPVTNYEYELEVNDSKRNILIPHPNVVGQIVNEHQRKIRK